MQNQTEWDLGKLLERVQDGELRQMISDFWSGPEIHQPSHFWKKFASLNIQQLQDSGLDNFKRTVNQNYFNWVGDNLKEQRDRLRQEVGLFRYYWAWFRGCATFSDASKPEGWSGSKWRKYRFFLLLLWTYVTMKDERGWLTSLAEPAVGNPMALKQGSRLISQDVCNSMLEVKAALEAGPALGASFRCAELGAGYGRVAHCLLQLCPQAKYAIIDIPPALYVSQWYLGRTLPGRKIFRYRAFNDFDCVREEFESADLAFLLPHQVALLPDKYFDLFINISSLHEMTVAQIRYWFEEIDRVCRGRFYSKQWIVHTNELDNILVKREDYPVRTNWKASFDRKCTVQPGFFEALYELSPQAEPVIRN